MCTVSLMCLNHPKTVLPTLSVENLSSAEPAPGAKEAGDRCSKPLDAGIMCDPLKTIFFPVFSIFFAFLLTGAELKTVNERQKNHR